MGKTSQSSTRGKQDSKERVSSAKNIDVTSRKITIWPEWTDAELAAEKWDLGGGKGKDKGRGSQAVVLYEDPEGVVLPPSLAKGGRVCWKRITDPDVLPDEPPVIVSDPECTEVDLVSANSHLMQSELMCWIISQLQALWEQRHCVLVPLEGSGSNSVPAWRPWEHIHPHPKGAPAPQFNTGGKYCVRLYWMGSWRKVTIDDQLPFWEPEEAMESQQAPGGRGFTLLLPATPSPRELWPALLTKAILKIAALDYGGGSKLSEFGECSVIHLLTGWTLQVLPIRSTDSAQLWELLTDVLPLWERPAEEGEGEGTRQVGSSSKDSEAPQPKQSAILLLASFTGSQQESDGEPLLQPPLIQKTSTSEGLLKRSHLLSPRHGLARVPSHPMLLMQVRDEPLEPPPKEPPPPTLQAPYYLGLRHRQTWPGDPTPPPAPLNAEQKFVEISPPFPPTSEDSSGEGRSGKRVWIDYPHFINAFTRLHVFRNPASFPHKEVYCNLSRTVENSALSGATTKKASSSQLASASKAAFSNKDQNILFVDSPAPMTLHLVFSSLSNWREGQRNLQATARPSIGLLERPSTSATAESAIEDSSDSTEADEVPAATTTTTTTTTITTSTQAREHIAAGTLTVEPYRWDSLQAGPPVLRVATTGTRGTTLSIPAGRHVFTLHIQAPIGHHLEVFSLSPFQLTNGDAIFSLLSKESSRFLLHCSQFSEALLSVTEGGGESQAVEERMLPLVQGLKSRHMQLMLASGLHAVASLGPGWGINESMTSSWRAFLGQVFSSLEPHLPSDGRPAMDVSTAGKLLGSHGSPKTTPSRNRSVTPAAAGRRASAATVRAPSTTDTASGEQEHQSAAHGSPGSKLLQRASTISTTDVWESLAQSVALVEPHSEALGTAIFSGLFELDPSALRLFPFQEDEQTRAYSRVLSGSLPSLQPHSWMVVFREVFRILETQLIVPRLQCPVSSCLLRVIDNDTGAETPRVFQSVAPHTYQPNKAGYTFIAEAWSESEGVEGGQWEMRLVCSSARVPVRREGEGEDKGEVSSTFHTHEIQEYCLPNRESQLFRFAVKVTQDCPVSIQLSTSKRDAYFKLEVLDHEIPVTGTQGRGHGVIPVCNLLGGSRSRAAEGNTIAEEEEEEAEEGEDTSTANLEDEKPHKYILQATILRDSWPIADTAWPYISMIKSMEKLDEGRPGSEQLGSGSAKKTKSKEKGGGKKGAAQSVPAKMDASKPHWTLRVVTKNEDKECLEVHKDTERADELKGMVQAWEVEQPGRCKKAQESRQKFLESRALKDTAEEDQSTAVSVLSESSSVPQPPSGPVQLRQIDLSPFIVSDGGSPHLLDETEQSVQQQKRQRLFREYRAERQAVLQRREADRETRNQAKVAQLELAEQWQADLDELRNKLNAGRQAIRERHLAKERAKMEAEPAAQKATEEQPAAGRESKKGKAKGKK